MCRRLRAGTFTVKVLFMAYLCCSMKIGMIFVKLFLKVDRSGQKVVVQTNWQERSFQLAEKSELFQEELVDRARKRANCKKPNSEENYVICDKLPFTEIKCGSVAPSSDQMSTIIPNEIHFLWLGGSFQMDSFIQYLSLRSAASIQRPSVINFYHEASDVPEMTPLWRRVLEEIPCMKVVPVQPETNAFGRKFKNFLAQSDFFRLALLHKQGGIYLDLDVITLKPFNQLRIYPAVIGRSLLNKVSNGIIFAEPGSTFIDMWIRTYTWMTSAKPFAYWGLDVPYQLYVDNPDVDVHMELSSMNRPNPFMDEIDSTSSGNYNLSENFFLHVHPQVFPITKNEHLLSAHEHEVRVMDNTYGAAARIALFGSSDIVFLNGERPFRRKLARNLPKMEAPRKEKWG